MKEKKLIILQVSKKYLFFYFKKIVITLGASSVGKTSLIET